MACTTWGGVCTGETEGPPPPQKVCAAVNDMDGAFQACACWEAAYKLERKQYSFAQGDTPVTQM